VFQIQFLDLLWLSLTVVVAAAAAAAAVGGVFILFLVVEELKTRTLLE
jgi:hypothetical protein